MKEYECVIRKQKAYLRRVQEEEPQRFALFQTIPGVDEYHATVFVIEYGGRLSLMLFQARRNLPPVRQLGTVRK
ncbi:MAG: hypothetical protein IJU76_15385 [Desulfovibrionaceae bacterium]|nr:hypothetical protein [Desulfovibrionaceae bacterium]